MKKVYFLLILFGFVSSQHSQKMIGKFIDQNRHGLRDLTVNRYSNSKVYTTTSDGMGTFVFNDITDVTKDDEIPTGYSISDNYPNPFNPKTRITLTLPNNGNVRITLFNVAGQRVLSDIEKFYDAGTNFLDLELNGLPNGIYFARLTLDGKYTITKKLMLLYGSQHLSSVQSLLNNPLNKTTDINNLTITITIDSLVVTSPLTGRKTFKNLPTVVDSFLNLGDLTIERFCAGLPTVTYEGKTYNTVQMGTQCWLRENLDVGKMIISVNYADTAKNNGIIEKYCFYNDTSNCRIYGGLYNWREAMAYSKDPGARGICPENWHLPTQAEMEALADIVHNDGNSLKEFGIGALAGIGTNASGFSALIAGTRSLDHFGGGVTLFWSSTHDYNGAHAYYIYLNDSVSPIGFGFMDTSVVAT